VCSAFKKQLLVGACRASLLTDATVLLLLLLLLVQADEGKPWHDWFWVKVRRADGRMPTAAAAACSTGLATA
jgi:hypothetical protein